MMPESGWQTLGAYDQNQQVLVSIGKGILTEAAPSSRDNFRRDERQFCCSEEETEDGDFSFPQGSSSQTHTQVQKRFLDA